MSDGEDKMVVYMLSASELVYTVFSFLLLLLLLVLSSFFSTCFMLLASGICQESYADCFLYCKTGNMRGEFIRHMTSK